MSGNWLSLVPTPLFAASPKPTFYRPIASTQVATPETDWPECA